MSYRFSIIIPTYNRARLLEKALQSVQQLRVPKGCTAEVLVIDNNCTDDTAEVARRFGRKGPLPVRHIIEHRQGLNHGRNRGLEEAAFEHLVYLDDDMTVVPGWLEGYVEAYEEFAPDAVVGPVDPEFETPVPNWLSARMLDSISSAYSRKGDTMFVVPLAQAHELPGCNFGVVRTVAREVGGFHPRLDRCGGGMLGGGDWEFGERLVRTGKNVAYAPKCRIKHLISRKKMSPQGLRTRWEGMGATHRACMILSESDLPAGRATRLFMRMLRLYARSRVSRLNRQHKAALQWELEMLFLRGMLFRFPRDLKPLRLCVNDE